MISICVISGTLCNGGIGIQYCVQFMIEFFLPFPFPLFLFRIGPLGPRGGGPPFRSLWGYIFWLVGTCRTTMTYSKKRTLQRLVVVNGCLTVVIMTLMCHLVERSVQNGGRLVKKRTRNFGKGRPAAKRADHGEFWGISS